ncbi:hypothetical protein R1flu_025503 [Riccia fluitans]|uniref:Ubiquitinyl hydrolase 1 n=1 Tax=Riccia fluitans TaxID=41844 RepID=A0ABD1Y101_9MARC
MGKRAKKKVQSAPGKFVAGSRLASNTLASSAPSLSEGGRLEETGCQHGANIDKLRTQLAKASAIHCQECAKLRSGKERRGGKGKPLNKKGLIPSPLSPFSDEKASSQKLWICLWCGHAGCGAGNSGLGGVNGSNKFVAKQGVVGRGHAWQHWLQLKHPMVMLCGDEFMSWCFQCEASHEHNRTEGETKSSELESQRVSEANTLDSEMSAEIETRESPEVESGKSAEDKEDASVALTRDELLQQCADLVQKKLVEQATEVKELSAGGPQQEDEKSRSGGVIPEEAAKPKRVIKGLLNLGNTCFFNSVMQNLLGLEILRDHFLGESAEFEGSLTTSLRKFFQEVTIQPANESVGMNGLEGGPKRGAKARGGWTVFDGVHNPKGLFGAICAKAPRFKGYQQQDSHELLKCLLDGLHTEEETARKLFTTANKKADDHTSDLGDTEVDGEKKTILSTEANGAKGLEKKQEQVETFVDKVFGGQLSSTVSCCECGHSSVVYEPFLDLSLSIPAKKVSQPTQLQSVSEASAPRVLTKSQRMHSLRPNGSPLRLNTGEKLELEDDVLNSTSSHIAGLGTPILLLPPPPPKGNIVDSLTLSTVSDDTSWLDFLDDSEDLESQVTYGCAPNPEEYGSGCASSLYAPGCFVDQDFEMIEGSVANGASVKQSCLSAGDVASLHALNAHRFEEITDDGGMDGSLVTTLSSADPRLDTGTPCEKLLLLEAPRQSWSETNLHSMRFDSGSGHEEDGFVQIRGGSESQVLLLTQGDEVDYIFHEPVVDNSLHPGTSAEQFGNCDDDSKLLSENVTRHTDTGPLSDSAQGDAGAHTIGEAQGDYDGVASLFEEEESQEYGPSYGPCPLNHDTSGYEGSGGFEEVGLDDVLDLGKISCEGRDDWLVCTNDQQIDNGEEVAVSLEGCLQIFTRPEILSGENAWGCENCTKRYYEKLAGGLEKSDVTLSEKDLPKRVEENTIGKNGNLLGDGNYLPISGEGEPLSSSGSQEDLRTQQEDSSLRDDGVTDVACTSISDHEEVASQRAIGTGGVAVKVHPSSEDVTSDGPSSSGPATASCENWRIEKCFERFEDAGLEKTEGKESRVGSSETIQGNGDLVSVRSTAGEAELRDSPCSSLSNGLGNTTGKDRDASGGESSSLSDESNAQKSEPGAAQNSEKTTNFSSSRRNAKLTKSRSKKVVPEPRKVIKQEATKRYLISKAPPVLVVQLKRFARDMRGRLSKLYGPVEFQECLDLSPYVDQRHVTSQNCRYRLTGTVEHSGTLKGGHYVASVRGPQAATTDDSNGSASPESTWYHISDSYVRQTSLDAVLKSEAYLLFYERC